MMWAYVYVLNTKKQEYVSVDKLLNFSLESYDENKNLYEKKVFFWQNKANESPLPVYVLLISSSLPLLKTQVSRKRPVLPKIRYSDFNAKYEPPENEVNEVKHVKITSKKKDDGIKASRKEKESEIIKAHIDVEKQKGKKKQENISYGNSSKSDSDQLLKSTYNYKLLDIISAIDDVETIKKVKCLFSDYQTCLAERDELKKKLDDAQEIIKILTDTSKETNAEKENSQKLDAIFDLLNQVADYMFSVNTLCTKTKHEELLELDSDTEIVSDANKSLHKNTDENKSSPSVLDSRPVRKRSRLAFYPVKDATVIENRATTLMNNTSEISDEDEVIEASPPMQTSVASKVKQCLSSRGKFLENIDFGLCPSPKHTSTQMENVNTLKEQTANKNEMDDFNLDNIENKPPKKNILLDKFNVWSKRKDISEQLNMRCKADRAKLNGWDCWECREYYNNLSLSKEDLQKRKNQCSRHRRKYERPNTPEGFWDPGFPETLSTY